MPSPSYLAVRPTGSLVELFKYWERQHHLHSDQMRSRLVRLIKTGVIEVEPALPPRWELRGPAHDGTIKTSAMESWSSTGGWHYRILRASPRVFGPAQPMPEPVSSPSPKIKGRHKSSDQAVSEASAVVTEIEAYQRQHGCTQGDALEALHRKLGHASAGAMKAALKRARKLLAASQG